jgi:hypothetical protein
VLLSLVPYISIVFLGCFLSLTLPLNRATYATGNFGTEEKRGTELGTLLLKWVLVTFSALFGDIGMKYRVLGSYVETIFQSTCCGDM